MPTNSVVLDDLVKNYKSEIVMYVERINNEGKKAIPFIISRISFSILPNMMQDVSRIKNMNGHQKKQLVEDAIILIIDEVYKKLNEDKSLKLSDEEWDEQIRDLLKILIPTTIDLLIDVENGKLRLNKRTFSCCSCIRGN